MIALVVTIIVLLILAGITIQMILGENGIINRAQDARLQQALAEKKEEVEMAISTELSKNNGFKEDVKVTAVLVNIKGNYSKQEEKDSIDAESENSNDTFPGTITYGRASTKIPEVIVAYVDEDLNVTMEAIKADDYSNLPKVAVSNTGPIDVNGTYCNPPDLSGFKPDSTYYITYDENGQNEQISGRIDRVSVDGNMIDGRVWYDYANKIWGNIVTVTGKDVTYWTWIPRYKYKENTSANTSDIKFVVTSDDGTREDVCYKDVNDVKTEIDVSSYTLSDAFEFDDTHLTGYWASKYEIQGEDTEAIYVTNGNKQVLNTTNKSSPNDTYTVYVEGVEYASNKKLPLNLTGLNQGHDIVVYNETSGKVIGRTKSSVDNIKVDLSGFNPENTYYVTYDENGGNETIVGSVASTPQPADWYDYNRKIWANLVTVTGNEVTYWTYIPRYEYSEVKTTATTDIHFIPKSKKTADDSWAIPDSFKFGETDLDGYWATKYEIQDAGTSSEIENINYRQYGNMVFIDSSNPSGTYTIFVNGKKYREGVSLNNPYQITVDNSTNYNIMVVSETSNRPIGSTNGDTRNIQIDLTGFNKDCTYYVVYDSEGNEVVTDINVDYDANGTPTNIPNENIGIWYDYNKKLWANIVTKNNNEIAYWTYIPRYEFLNNFSQQKTEIHFIPVTQLEPDEGWIISDAFSFDNKPLKGYWASKYEIQ